MNSNPLLYCPHNRPHHISQETTKPPSESPKPRTHFPTQHLTTLFFPEAHTFPRNPLLANKTLKPHAQQNNPRNSGPVPQAKVSPSVSSGREAALTSLARPIANHTRDPDKPFRSPKPNPRTVHRVAAQQRRGFSRIERAFDESGEGTIPVHPALSIQRG